MGAKLTIVRGVDKLQLYITTVPASSVWIGMPLARGSGQLEDSIMGADGTGMVQVSIIETLNRVRCRPAREVCCPKSGGSSRAAVDVLGVVFATLRSERILVIYARSTYYRVFQL